MEEVFEKTEGVIEVVSGYSGGNSKNPTYREVTYGDTGHFEVVEVVYNKSKINFENVVTFVLRIGVESTGSSGIITL